MPADGGTSVGRRYRPGVATDRVEETADVVFVCTGNRARSPLAAALLARRLAGLPVRVRSRGTADVGAVGVLPEMALAARGLGLDLSRHRAAALRPKELADADLVLGFEPFHVAAAVVEGGAATERSFTLPELVRLAPDVGHDGRGDVRAHLERLVADAHRLRTGDRLSAPGIADPLGRPESVVAAVAHEIDELVARLGDLLVGPPDRTATLAR